MTNDLKKPKFYSNHRYRQDQKREKYSESNNDLKEKKCHKFKKRRDQYFEEKLK